VIPRLNKKSLSWPAGHCRSVARCAIGCEGWAWALCTTELPTTGFAAQTKEERKTKGWDEKEAIGNELLGNAFFGMMPRSRYNRGRQRNLRLWPCDRVAGFNKPKYFARPGLTTRRHREPWLAPLRKPLVEA